MARRYITATEFRDFSLNQSKLIGILNHNMTKLSTDVSWLKKLAGWQIGFLAAIAATVICGFIKLVYLGG